MSEQVKPASEQKPIAWATTNEDGDYAMLFFDQQEARNYSGDDEPIGLVPVSSSAPQPDYKAQRDAERWEMVETLMFLGNVELNQDDDGGYSILLEPAENIVAQHWIGNSPEEAIDASIASVKGGA